MALSYRFIESQYWPFVAGAAIGQNVLVKISSSKLAVCGVNEVAIGTTCDATFADGDVVTVRLNSPAVIGQADGAITSGALVYQQASGQVSASSGSSAHVLGVALNDTTTSGDKIAYVPSGAEGIV